MFFKELIFEILADENGMASAGISITSLINCLILFFLRKAMMLVLMDLRNQSDTKAMKNEMIDAHADRIESMSGSELAICLVRECDWVDRNRGREGC